MKHESEQTVFSNCIALGHVLLHRTTMYYQLFEHNKVLEDA